MDSTTLLGVLATLAVFIVWLWLRRVNRRIEQSPDYPFVRMGTTTVVAAMMIGMSIASPEMWGPAGGWMWIFMVASVTVWIAIQWRRVLRESRDSGMPVNPPAANPDG